jgi:hypothetical protein
LGRDKSRDYDGCSKAITLCFAGTFYRLLVGKPEGERPLGTPRHRLVDNIKIDLWRDRMEWSGVAQDREKWRVLVNVVMNLRVPQYAGGEWTGFLWLRIGKSVELL